MEKLESLIKTYYDFPKKGIAFKDLLGIIQDSEVFRELILIMSSNKVIKNSEAIISIEARGFIFGSAISLQACKPMIVARKPGKLPGEIFQEHYSLEYGNNTLSVGKEALEKFSSYAIVDDLLATGGTALAAVELIENFKNKNIVGAGFIINLPDLNGDKKLKDKGINIHSLMEF